MATQLSAEEQAIIDYVESGDATSIDDLDAEINRYTQIAHAQMSKKKNINIQLPKSDIEGTQTKSANKFSLTSAAKEPILNKSSIQSMILRQSIIDKTMTASIDIARQSMATQQQSLMDKIMAASAVPSVIDIARQSMATQQQLLMDKIMAASAVPLVIDIARQSMATQQQLLMDKIMAASAVPLVIDIARQSMATQQQSLMDKIMAASAVPSAIETALKIFTESSHLLLTEPDCFAAMAESIADIDIRQHIYAFQKTEDHEIVEQSSQLYDAKDSQSFIQFFQGLPPYLQAALFFILIQIVLPQVNSVSANLLTPFVESYLKASESPNREQIKVIKRLPLNLDDIYTNDLRFISRDNVYLRKAPSTKSEISDEVVLGQVVTVLSKNRNWIEITYEYDNGEIMHGWVFTRYTAKFIK